MLRWHRAILRPISSPPTEQIIFIYTYLGYIHELWWQEGGGMNHDVLTAIAGAPLAASDPSAYFDAPNSMHHIIYRSTDGHLHDLQRSK